ncbi:MAG: DNA replication and repair protein RecF [Verrucomicrobiales bacterium]|jgi:DNA replication and repair protein RecF
MLTSLKARQLRCFDTVQCEFGEGVTIFVGSNAQGKTSILEAVCIAMRLQSPRTSSLGEVIQFEKSEFAVSSEFRDQQLLVGYKQANRKLSVDGTAMRRSGDYLEHSGRVVWMANDDLDLIRGGGDGRRRYLDFMGTQLFPGYRPALRAYERALRSRNFLLKRDARPNWAQIDAYTKVLAEHGAVLTSCRAELVMSLDPFSAEVQREVSGAREALTLTYKSGDGDRLVEVLAELREEESKRRSTIRGPHRDDLLLSLNGMPAGQFASEGQQRTVALALKIGQARLFHERADSWPLLLLDDIFGELDPTRRNALMSALPGDAQKLITTTHLDWLDERLAPDLEYRVVSGAVERQPDR